MKFNEPRILFHFPPITTALKFHAHQQREKLRRDRLHPPTIAKNWAAHNTVVHHILRFPFYTTSRPHAGLLFSLLDDGQALVIFLLLSLFLIHRFRSVDCTSTGVQLLLTSFSHILLESERRWK
jgi:uncharacterized membrane protein